MGTSLKICGFALILTVPAGVLSCSQSVSNRPDPQVEILKKWTLSRCLSQAAANTPAGDDAAKTASAYLEMGHAMIEVYEKLDAMAKEYLTRTYTGSVKSPYDTMKCIDLFESPELDRIARDVAKP